METKLVDELIACLRGDKTTFHYFNDCYALMLLARVINNNEVSVSSIKQSPVGKLLHRPLIKQIVANKGGGKINHWDLLNVMPQQYNHYVLTIDRWSHKKAYRYDQTSRLGENIVLQLNFNKSHDVEFCQSTGLNIADFNGSYHPTCQRGRYTLAWSRLDIDFESNQALIEEIQTDWLRDVMQLKNYAAKAEANAKTWFMYWGTRVATQTALAYANKTLAKHKHWQDAMLAATLQFLWNEIGIKEVFYHDYETGKALKNISCNGPPRSLYKTLPKRFCFESVKQGPKCIESCKAARKRLKAVNDPKWFQLAV